MWFLSNIIVNIFNYYNQLFTIWLYAYQTRKNHQDQTLSGGEGERERERERAQPPILEREHRSLVLTIEREREMKWWDLWEKMDN